MVTVDVTDFAPAKEGQLLIPMVSVARLNATRRLIDARSSVIEPLQPAGGGPACRGTTALTAPAAAKTLTCARNWANSIPRLRLPAKENPAEHRFLQEALGTLVYVVTKLVRYPVRRE